jgi:CheY-like chemotaxis protein
MIVLYAEDDIEDVDTFCDMMVSIDPTVKCLNTQNGAETIEFLENTTVLPDIIFLDINMPTMDGRSCLRTIRKDDRFKSIPIIIYTTSGNPKDRELCLQLGANDYVQKPNTIRETKEELSRFIRPESVAH